MLQHSDRMYKQVSPKEHRIMPRSLIRVSSGLIVAATTFALAVSAHAQQNSLFGGGGGSTGGGFGRTGTMGGSLPNGSTFGGGNSMSTSAFGSSAFGQSQNRGFASTGFGQSALGQSAFGQAGRGTGQTGFLGANTTGNFIGANQTGNQQMGRNNQFNRGGNRGAGARDVNSQFGNMNAFTQQGGLPGGGAAQQRQVRPQLRVAFDYKPRTTAQLDQSLNTRFEKLGKRFAERAAFQGVTVSVEDGVATLRGRVATEGDKRLAGMMARIEPGVRGVIDDDLLVTSAPVEEE
ncbi:MAG: BON domain-containing protein [Planctomycetaceae bacterium]